MKYPLKKTLISALLILPAISLNLYADEGSLVQEKNLDLSKIFITVYALGCDISEVKEKEEGIYLAKGDVNNSLAVLKDILIEHTHPFDCFEEGEQINAIIFRGILLKHGKIAINTVIYKETSFAVYAHYDDTSDLNIPSQPAAIIPLGKLPIGKYRIKLYVEGQESKQKDFIVRRAPFKLDLTKNLKN